MSNHKGIFKNSEIETLSSKLKFVGKIKSGQKINVETQSIQENTYWTSMSRTMSGESRNKVYNYISDVIQDSLSILDSLSNSSNEYDIKVCKNLITDLINLNPGVTSLQETYASDKMYVAKLQTLSENLEVKLKELCSKRTISYDELFELAQVRAAEDDTSSSGEESPKPEIEETKPEKETETPVLAEPLAEQPEEESKKKNDLKPSIVI